MKKNAEFVGVDEKYIPKDENFVEEPNEEQKEKAKKIQDNYINMMGNTTKMAGNITNNVVKASKFSWLILVIPLVIIFFMIVFMVVMSFGMFNSYQKGQNRLNEFGSNSQINVNRNL